MKKTRVFGFEKLDVWQEARSLAVDICRACDLFPQKEQFGLASQLRRSIVSVPSNIAEGAARGGRAEFSRFIGIAYASLMEAVTQLIITQDLGYLSINQVDAFKCRADKIAKMLSGLRHSIAATKPSTINLQLSTDV